MKLRRASQVAVVGLFVLAAIAAAWYASSFLVPILAAAVLFLLLRPVVVRLAAWHVPRWLSAALILVAGTVAVGAGIQKVQGPAVEWLERAPQLAFELRYKLAELREPVEKAKKASEQVEKITQIADGSGEPREVVVKAPGFLERVSDNMLPVVLGFAMALILLYFMLATGDSLFVTLLSWTPAVHTKEQAMALLSRIQNDVSIYLATVCLINVGLGLALGVVFYLTELPNAALWAVMAACLNFVPFVGALVSLVVVTLVSLLTFDTLGAALAPPIIFLIFTTLEGQIITPTLVGHRFAINPLTVILAVLFGTGLWGVAGALLALPLLICARAIVINAFPESRASAAMQLMRRHRRWFPKRGGGTARTSTGLSTANR